MALNRPASRVSSCGTAGMPTFSSGAMARCSREEKVSDSDGLMKGMKYLLTPPNSAWCARR